MADDVGEGIRDAMESNLTFPNTVLAREPKRKA
jgi:hypothetical protein